MVIHGTDTMAFAASVLSFVLENLQKAVILTGAQVINAPGWPAHTRLCGPSRGHGVGQRRCGPGGSWAPTQSCGSLGGSCSACAGSTQVLPGASPASWGWGTCCRPCGIVRCFILPTVAPVGAILRDLGACRPSSFNLIQTLPRAWVGGMF